MKAGVFLPPTNETSILFIVPASDIKSSSVSAGAEVKAVCPDIILLFKCSLSTASSTIELAVTESLGTSIVPTDFA